MDTSEGQSGGAVASSAAEEARSGSRGEKRDVRGLRREAQGGPEAASSASPSGAGRTRSVYMPVKLQDLAQIGQAGELMLCLRALSLASKTSAKWV